MSKKSKDIKHQLEKTLHTVADVAQQQYEKNLKKAHKNVDKQVGSVRDRLEEFDSWAVESVNEALENVEKKLEKKVTKTLNRVQKAARSAWEKLTD
jgi:vacuolar-type H+-ATPase subunit E/Vma4